VFKKLLERISKLMNNYQEMVHLCGLVVIVPGNRSRGLGSIPGLTRFSEKQWVRNGVHSDY
jgi:hypothetical protein